MKLVLYLIPIFSLISSLILYRHVGKREVFKLDLVQFIYVFIISPLLFIWLKSFLYFLLRSELNLYLSTSDLLIIDTAFSLIFMYIYAFVVMHGLTKSFNLKMSEEDPLYDIFYHSEYIHLWLSHIVVFVGAMAVITLFATLNIFVPLQIDIAKGYFYLICATGWLSGVGSFIWAWISDPQQENANFMRLMKLAFGLFFAIHIVLFFLFDPDFNERFVIFWFSLFQFAMTVTISLFVYKSVRAKTVFSRMSDYFKHEAWNFRTQLFKK